MVLPSHFYLLMIICKHFKLNSCSVVVLYIGKTFDIITSKKHTFDLSAIINNRNINDLLQLPLLKEQKPLSASARRLNISESNSY